MGEDSAVVWASFLVILCIDLAIARSSVEDRSERCKRGGGPHTLAQVSCFIDWFVHFVEGVLHNFEFQSVG